MPIKELCDCSLSMTTERNTGGIWPMPPTAQGSIAVRPSSGPQSTQASTPCSWEGCNISLGAAHVWAPECSHERKEAHRVEQDKPIFQFMESSHFEKRMRKRRQWRCAVVRMQCLGRGWDAWGLMKFLRGKSSTKRKGEFRTTACLSVPIPLAFLKGELGFLSEFFRISSDQSKFSSGNQHYHIQ